MPDPTGAPRPLDAVQSDLAEAERRLRDAETRADAARRAARQEAREVEERSDRGEFDIDESAEDAAYAETDRLQAEAGDAGRAVDDARAEVAELRAELGSLPTDEDILAETDDAYAAENEKRHAAKYWVAGGILGLIGAFLLWQAFQVPGGTPEPVSQASESASASAGPSGSTTPAATASPTTTPEPITEAPEGSAQALASFTRTSGSCPFAPEYDAAFLFESADGTLTATQVGAVEQVISGPFRPDGTFQFTGPNEMYEGLIDGTLLNGTYTYTGDGCNDVWEFDGDLLRPIGSTAPGYFEFFEVASGEVSLNLGDAADAGTVEVIVASQTLDVTGELPIRVVGTSGDDTLFDFAIEGDPTAVCRGPTGCSAPIPGNPAWADPSAPIVVVATGSGDDLIAITTPNGAPLDAEPTPAPTPPPTPSPSPSPTPAAAAPSATPGPSAPGGAGSTQGAPNVPLALAGLALIAGGLGVGFGGPKIEGRGSGGSTTGTPGAATPGGGDSSVTAGGAADGAGSAAAGVAAEIIAEDVAHGPLTGRPWKQ